MEHPVHEDTNAETSGAHQKKPDKNVWRKTIKKLTFRGRCNSQNGADLALGDQLSPVPKGGVAKDQYSSKQADTAGSSSAECAHPLKHSGLSLFRGITFQVVDESRKEEAVTSSRFCLPAPERADVYGSRLREGTAVGTIRPRNTGKEPSFRLREFPVKGTTLSVMETNRATTLGSSSGDARCSTSLKRQRWPPLFTVKYHAGRGEEYEGTDSQRAGDRAAVTGKPVLGRYSFLLDVDAAKELPPSEVLQLQRTKRSDSCLHRLYRTICKHPVYKFFPDEDVRYFDIMVTGIPVYFSSKKLERSFVLYSCPALSGYIIGFHSLFILCTVLEFILCFVVQPGFFQTWKMQLPFFFSWAISFGSVVVTIIWRVTGGRKAERFNTRENKLMKKIELPAGMVIQEAVHWRPCFTEDFAAVSFSLALGIPTVVSGSISAYLYWSTKDDPPPPGAGHRLPPIFSSPSGLFGFAASQAYLALSVLFLSFAVLASGIRVRKLVFVCVALLLSTIFFHICCSLVFYERTLLLPGILFTYSMIPISIISRMRMERLRRFLFLLHERAQYAQQEYFEDSTYGIRSSTPMEELIMLINEAGLKVREARSKYRYKKSPELLESEAMLVRCLMILTAGGDLFAFRLNEGEEGNEKEVRDDLLNIIGSSARSVCRTSRRDACCISPAVRDLICVPEDEEDQSQERGVDRAADTMTSFHADPVLDLWAILDLSFAPTRTDDSLVSNGPSGTVSRRDDRTEQSALLAHLPVFPSARIRVAYSRRLSIDWDLNMIEVENECKGCCLYRVGCDLISFKVHGFECSKEIMKNFMKVVQLCYQQTIYHNHMHGAQVAHNTVWLARKLNLISDLDAAELVGVIIAALCHDIGHQGKNNAYYVTSGASVICRLGVHDFCPTDASNRVNVILQSLIYNDTAVLENFHACTTFKILARPDCNIFTNLEQEAFRLLRTRIIELILATDMKMHFETISKFRLRRNAPDFALTSEDDRWMALRMCIKGGDLSHATLNWDSHVSWSYRATAEFYEQGDLERSQGRTVANMFDRRKHADFPKGQEAFIKYIVVPLYEEIAAVDATGEVQSECLRRVSENRERWCHLQNNPAEFTAVDDEQQRIITKLKEELQVSAKTNVACTQALLRAAHRSGGDGSSKGGGGALLGIHSTRQCVGSGKGTAAELQESLAAKAATVANPPVSNLNDDRAPTTAGKAKKREVQRVVDVVTAVRDTVQYVAKHAAESAAKAAKEMGNTGGRAAGSADWRVGEAATADSQHTKQSPDKAEPPRGNFEASRDEEQQVKLPALESPACADNFVAVASYEKQ